MGTTARHTTVLRPVEEAMIIALRKRTLLSTDKGMAFADLPLPGSGPGSR